MGRPAPVLVVFWFCFLGSESPPFCGDKEHRGEGHRGLSDGPVSSQLSGHLACQALTMGTLDSSLTSSGWSVSLGLLEDLQVAG